MIQKTRIMYGGNTCELLSIYGNCNQFSRWFTAYNHPSSDQYYYKIWKFANCTPQVWAGSILHRVGIWEFKFGNESVFTEVYKKYVNGDYKIFTLRTSDLTSPRVDFCITKLFKPEFVVEITNTPTTNRFAL